LCQQKLNNMAFKFLTNEEERLEERSEAEVMRERDEVYQILENTFYPEGEIPQSETLPRYDPDGTLPPAVFTTILRNRDAISDEEYTHLLREQRRLLIERMWETGQVMHTIVSQDENGFTLRTEISL